MRALLDTHTFLWAITSPDNLSRRARSIIENARNTLLVSSATAWEVATKHRLGRLPEAAAVLEGYYDHLATFLADELPITSQHALSAGAFAHAHRDPFDRLLAAQSVLEKVPLITPDRVFALFPITVIW